MKPLSFLLFSLLELFFMSLSLFSSPASLSYLESMRADWFSRHLIEKTDFIEFWTRSPLSTKEKEDQLLWIIALSYAYPQFIESVRYQKGDWAFSFKDKDVLFWAQGRMLPENLKDQSQQFQNLFSYSFVKNRHESALWSPETKKTLLDHYNRPAGKGKPQGLFWWEKVYGASSKDALIARMQETTFLGFEKLMVHPLLLEPLKRAEAQIWEKLREHPSLLPVWESFKDSLKSSPDGVTGFQWREVSGTNSLSYHSFGVAIDFWQEDRVREKPYYWQNQRDQGVDWTSIPYSERFQIPEFIKEILEKEDFLWGSLWVNWDDQHFEWRPEVYRQHTLDQEFRDYMNIF